MKLPEAAVACTLFLAAGCGALGDRDPTEFAGDSRELTWEEYDEYREIVARKTADPKDPHDMAEALVLYRRMVATRPGDVGTLVEAAETALWLAESEESSTARRQYAEEAVHYARAACRKDGWNARAHYRRAIALGYYAREDHASALGMIPEMEEAARAAIEHDERFDRAGPHRYLALLYAQAPGFPTSIGDIDAAYEHAEKAVELFPEDPENHVVLAEVMIEDGEDEEAVAELEKAIELARASEDPDAAGSAEKARSLLDEVGAAE